MKQYMDGRVKMLDDDGRGTFEVVLSAPTLDRDGEVIDSGAFEPLPGHITFDIDHGLSVATTVASGVPSYEDGLLIVRGEFSSIPRAQEVRTLVREGHIRSTSVAFMDSKKEVKDGIPHIVKAEILNGAFVPVPSNREAVVIAAKTFREAAMPGVKAVAGSFEERRDLITEAVRLAHPDAWWTLVVATFDDAVVFEVEDHEGTSRWQADYTIDDEGVVSLTGAELVTVHEVVELAEDAGDDLEDVPVRTPDEPAAAPAAAALSVPTARVRADAAEAEAALLTIV